MINRFTHVMFVTTSPVWLFCVTSPQKSALITELGSGAGTSLAHCTVTLGGQVIVGGVLSVIVMVCRHVLELPQSSVAVNVRRIVNSCGHIPGAKSVSSEIATVLSQLSTAIAWIMRMI